MPIQGKESGLALIVTLLLGLIAAGFIGAMMYVLSSGTQISGMEARYTSALQAAKGGASFITQELSTYDLRCTDGSSNTCWCTEMNSTSSGQLKCPVSTSFDDSVNVELQDTEELGDYNLDANMVSYVKNETINTYIFTFDLTAEAKPTIGTDERSEIEFVYKLDYD